MVINPSIVSLHSEKNSWTIKQHIQITVFPTAHNSQRQAVVGQALAERMRCSEFTKINYTSMTDNVGELRLRKQRDVMICQVLTAASMKFRVF
jgi:hypothetical protein